MSNLTAEPIAMTSCNEILISADVKYKNRDYLGALSDYNLAIEIDPNCALAYCGRGLTFYRLHDISNAQLDYNLAIERDPKLAIAYYRRGTLNHVLKDYGKAIADYTKAISIEPDFALAYANRGDAYCQMYGEREGLIDWRFAAKLFQEAGNLPKYQEMMQLIDRFGDDDTCASGML